MRLNCCSIENCFLDKKSVEELPKSVKMFKDMQNCSLNNCALTKKQKRWVVENLIKFSRNYDEIWDIKKIANDMSYSLTSNQTERIIEKLVWSSDSDEDLKKVKEYACSKGLFRSYYDVYMSKKLAKVLRSWLVRVSHCLRHFFYITILWRVIIY